MAQQQIPEWRTTFDEEELFTFQFKLDGELHILHLKPAHQMPVGVLDEMRAAQEAGDDLGAVWPPLKWAAASPEDYRELCKVPSGPGIEYIMELWQQHGEIELGESRKSSGSSPNGQSEKPSKSTSSTSASASATAPASG